jgi:hypothetical protein
VRPQERNVPVIPNPLDEVLRRVRGIELQLPELEEELVDRGDLGDPGAPTIVRGVGTTR